MYVHTLAIQTIRKKAVSGIDAIRDNSVLKDLVNNQPSEIEDTLNHLVDETIPLNDRLSEFKTTMTKLLQGTTFNSKANDERTAATILTCFNPQKYTIYKDSVYRKLCAYLSVKPEKAGKKYQHYLELIRPLAEMISQDNDLKTIIANSAIANFLQSDLLMAQDVCWEIIDDESQNTNCWLLTWNPNNWNWDSYEDWAKGTKVGNSYSLDWTCSSKLPKIGDHIFLMKLGTKPRGIIAHGFVSKPSYETSHYDGEKAVAGITSPHIEVDFDDIKDYKTEPFLQIDTLDSFFPDQTWTPHSSGIKIKCNVNELLQLWNEFNNKSNNTKMNNFITLLEKTHNLILTGAPGTGKTYLAKQIAQQMIFGEVKQVLTDAERKQFDEQCGFVQFHPSYDYTDFVEGLRPIQDDNGSVGFERKDGVFKTFCANALENFLDSQKSIHTLQQEISVRDKIEEFLLKAIDDNIKYTTESKSNHFTITEFDDKKIIIHIPNNEIKRRVLKISDLIFLLESNDLFTRVKDISTVFSRHIQEDSYLYVLYKKIKESKTEIKNGSIIKIVQKPFVFIIDEINRGEISKIFGELFFSIDPGYRGVKGKVTTQYQNLIQGDDDFADGFFVPENVYIIGTMNDIDRSVESMDFAFRRRFTFVEIKANENTEMLNQLGDLKTAALNRMEKLNTQIEKTDNLNSAYHIGASYFLKLKDYNGDFQKLWEYHLEGLLREYLRGALDVDKKIKDLKKAYGDDSD